MILVCGDPADPVTALVRDRLDNLGCDQRLLDLVRYPDGYAVDWTWDGDWPTGTIVGPDWELDLAAIGGVFVRYADPRGHAPLPGVPPELREVALAECQVGLAALLECLPCPVANRLAASASNRSKPAQALRVRRTGLRVPRTLITSDPLAARAFYEECAGRGGAVVFKSLSGVRSIVRRMEERDLARLAQLRHGPAQFQEYVPGDNIRVHTVGDALFATRIRSEAVDYRYARHQGCPISLAPTQLPPAVAADCHALARDTGLLLAGIDLKETPDGAYYCFEINPFPGFAWYEHQTGQPIAAAVAALLHRGGAGSPTVVREGAPMS